jgi:hypothetical protein
VHSAAYTGQRPKGLLSLRVRSAPWRNGVRRPSGRPKKDLEGRENPPSQGFCLTEGYTLMLQGGLEQQAVSGRTGFTLAGKVNSWVRVTRRAAASLTGTRIQNPSGR